MSKVIYKCTNFGQCENATPSKTFALSDSDSKLCPGCDKPLAAGKAPPPGLPLKVIGGIAAGLLVGAGAWWFGVASRPDPVRADPVRAETMITDFFPHVK